MRKEFKNVQETSVVSSFHIEFICLRNKQYWKQAKVHATTRTVNWQYISGSSDAKCVWNAWKIFWFMSVNETH